MKQIGYIITEGMSTGRVKYNRLHSEGKLEVLLEVNDSEMPKKHWVLTVLTELSMKKKLTVKNNGILFIKKQQKK